MTLDYTWGGQNSNSYVSHTDASSFITTGMTFSTPWTSSTTAVQEAALMEASLALDALQYVGERFYPTQKLEWPRSLLSSWPMNLSYQSGEDLSIEQLQMKDAVQKATCYQAVFILGNNSKLRKHSANKAFGIKKYSEDNGPLQEFVEYSGVGQAIQIASEALRLLGKWQTSKRVYRA